MQGQELTPPSLESLKPRHPEIRYHEYTPTLDGHVHPYHVATIDLGHIDDQAAHNPKRSIAAFERRDELIAQALEVTETLFAARGGDKRLTTTDITRQPVDGSSDMLNAHACVRLTIFGSFGTPQR